MIKTKAFAALSLAALILNLTGLALADTHRGKAKKRQSNLLVAMLPASDGVATFDVKRFFNDALPKVLSANQPLLRQVMAHVSEMESKTGVDLRKFEQVAVGFTTKTNSKNSLDVDPVAIARGNFSADSLINTAKTAAQGKFREEKFGDRNLVIFPAKEAAKKNVPAAAIPAGGGEVVDTVIDGMPEEIAVTSLDSTTLVVGSVERVRQTIGRESTVSPEIISLLSTSETSVCTFALRTPEGMARIANLEKDQLGENINSIKFISGSMDVNAIGASVSMMARTDKAEQAKELSDTLLGLKMIGKAFLGSSKKPEQKVIGRMLENATILNRGTDVTVRVAVLQADINLLVATIK